MKIFQKLSRFWGILALILRRLNNIYHNNKALLVLSKILREIFRWYDIAIFMGLVYVLIKVSEQFPRIPADQNLLQNFIEWYAIFYTLALGLIIGESWNKLNKINSEVDREADALQLLVQAGRLFPNDDLGTRLFLVIKVYVDHIRSLRSKDRRTDIQSTQRMQEIRNCIDKMIQKDGTGSQESLKSELLHQYCEAYDARGDRFDLLGQKIPFHLWLLLIGFSLAWLWGFMWLEFDSIFFKRYILSSTVFSISYLFFLARDLDNPATGFWRMNFKPFDEF